MALVCVASILCTVEKYTPEVVKKFNFHPTLLRGIAYALNLLCVITYVFLMDSSEAVSQNISKVLCMIEASSIASTPLSLRLSQATCVTFA